MNFFKFKSHKKQAKHLRKFKHNKMTPANQHINNKIIYHKNPRVKAQWAQPDGITADTPTINHLTNESTSTSVYLILPRDRQITTILGHN